jgi:lipopolysaccharide transport system ATP-binding protein
MDKIILKAENISKQYRLGQVGTGTIKHDFNRFWHKIRGKEDPYLKVGAVNDRSSKAKEEYVWALRDINFEVQEGEVLGIIGKNGAGKSTLLKILSRVTSPTTGVIKTKGRIASLLEVGTGFHPELTGRENIYLNGAILGMTRAEITAKLDEIVEFSGCEMYIDTPTKRYSSGMTVRLAFAVAAHLEPDILVVDEVLAVGDAEFQKKAIGKMQDISKGEGRTVLFVSHNMAAVKSLCTRGIVLENGTSVFEGGAEEAISYYLNFHNEGLEKHKRIFKTTDFANNPVVSLEKISVSGKNKKNEEPISRDDRILLKVKLLKKDLQPITAIFRFKDEEGNYLFVNHSPLDFDAIVGPMVFFMEIPNHFFNEGIFYIDFLISHNKKIIVVENDVLSFTVQQESKALGDWMGKTKGPLKPNFEWYIN